jgi:hypothetical protein
MGRIEKTVFVSYRRASVSWALAVYQNLTQHGYDVFFDFTGIAGGDFEGAIHQNINSRAHFIVLLTESALHRCSEPGDWLRREIEAALIARRNIVPLMLEGCDFTTPAIAQRLSGTLAPLKRYNALSVPVAFFSEAMTRLREKYLNVPLDAVIHPPTPSAKRAAQHLAQEIAVRTTPRRKDQGVKPQTEVKGIVQEDWPTLSSLDPQHKTDTERTRTGRRVVSVKVKKHFPSESGIASTNPSAAQRAQIQSAIYNRAKPRDKWISTVLTDIRNTVDPRETADLIAILRSLADSGVLLIGKWDRYGAHQMYPCNLTDDEIFCQGPFEIMITERSARSFKRQLNSAFSDGKR